MFFIFIKLNYKKAKKKMNSSDLISTEQGFEIEEFSVQYKPLEHLLNQNILDYESNFIYLL